MSDELPTVNKIKALFMIANAPEAVGSLSQADRILLADAVEHDLDNASLETANDKERLRKLEGQVHALSDAIIVIAEPSDAVDGAVKAVKEKM